MSQAYFYPPKTGIYVTNYEKLHLFRPEDWIGVVCDESSAIKSFDGVRRTQVTEFLRTLPYRLMATATAAPNDYTELGTTSEALGVMGQVDMLNRFFKNDQNTSDVKKRWSGFSAPRALKSPGWRFKGHAEEPFWRFVCSWSRSGRKPSDLGPFSDERFVLPPLIEREHIVETRTLADGYLIPLPATNMQEEREERRRTIPERCELAAELVASTGKAFLMWCGLNDEGDLLERLMPDAVQISGADSDDAKEEKYGAYLSGQARGLISKQKIAAWGLNLQHCNHVVEFASHCYDERTEVLTKRGWLSFGDAAMEDEIATVNPASHRFEWQNPVDVIWSHYSGPMIHFGQADEAINNTSYDLLVTPNHRMLVQRCPVRYRQNAGEWHIQTAEELRVGFKRQEYRMMSIPGCFEGVSVTEVPIPERQIAPVQLRATVNSRGDRRGMTVTACENLDRRRLSLFASIPIQRFVHLAGWYLSEGCCRTRNGELDGQIVITQTDANPEYRREIIDLMNSLGFLTVYSKTKDVRGCSLQLADFLTSQFGHGSHNKFIPSWVKNLPPALLSLLRDTMLKGDGSGPHGRKKFYRTVSRRLADDFMEICLKTGIRGSINYRRDAGLYDVNLSRDHLSPSIHIEPQSVPYSGMIGCVTVPNSLIVVRRNGMPIVSGNSYESHYQGVRRCYRFGQQHPVTNDIIATEGQRGTLDNMRRKSLNADRMFDSLVRYMHQALAIDGGYKFDAEVTVPKWLQ